MSVYFMIFLWFHGISWLLKGGVAATEPSGYVPGLQRFRCRWSPGHVGHGGSPNHPKVDRSGIESHGDLGILLKRNHGIFSIQKSTQNRGRVLRSDLRGLWELFFWCQQGFISVTIVLLLLL
jgi:hypothetical protein